MIGAGVTAGFTVAAGTSDVIGLAVTTGVIVSAFATTPCPKTTLNNIAATKVAFTTLFFIPESLPSLNWIFPTY
jgi:hypothetical protein